MLEEVIQASESLRFAETTGGLAMRALACQQAIRSVSFIPSVEASLAAQNTLAASTIRDGRGDHILAHDTLE